jgi:hypothetical protein
MDYIPNIVDAVCLKRITLPTKKHYAVLLDEIESDSLIEYRFLLVVFDDETDTVCLIVSSEVNAMVTESEHDSYFLGLFNNTGHINTGASDDWGDLPKFEKGAVDLAIKYLSDC